MLIGLIYQKILGLPLVIWGGIFTFICLIITVFIALLTVKNIKPLPTKWHTNIAITTIILAAIHGLAAILAFLGV